MLFILAYNNSPDHFIYKLPTEIRLTADHKVTLLNYSDSTAQPDIIIHADFMDYSLHKADMRPILGWSFSYYGIGIPANMYDYF